MIGALIRNFSRVAYRHPPIQQDRPGKGPFGKLRVALLTDYFTAVSLGEECRIRYLTPGNFRSVLESWRPDLVFVESVFHGVGEEWRYKIGRQPFYLKLFPAHEITDLAARANDRNIPALFWNKDDKAFFDFFLEVAREFKYIFTTDSDCLPRYRQKLPPDRMVNLLGMPYQPAFHYFSGFAFEANQACFVGSYYRKILKARRNFLDMIFDSCITGNIKLNVFDRNSSRLSHFFEFRYPARKNLLIHPGVSYPETGAIYKKYAMSINVNSIADSPTMVSRRLLEILACGGICITNANPAVENEYGEFCHIVKTRADADEILSRLSFGPSARDMERAAAGAEYVAAHHTWRHRLEQLEETVNF